MILIFYGGRRPQKQQHLELTSDNAAPVTADSDIHVVLRPLCHLPQNFCDTPEQQLIFNQHFRVHSELHLGYVKMKSYAFWPLEGDQISDGKNMGKESRRACEAESKQVNCF